MPLDTLIEIVLPVFGFIAIGYLVVAGKLLREKTGDALADFVFAVAVPILLFRSLGTTTLPPGSPWPFWGAYFAAVAIVVFLGIVITQRVFGRDARAGVIGGMSAAYANTVMVGLPVMERAFGEEGLVVGFLLVAVHLPVMMAASAVLIEVAERRDGTATGPVKLGAAMMRVARSLIRNPLIIAILAGVAFRMSGLTLSGLPETLIDRIAETAIPLALISLGMTLNQYGISGNVRPAIVLGAVKLLVMPAIVYVFAVHILALPPIVAAVAVIAAACPTGVNAYLLAGRFQTGLALSANTITLTTAVSIVTFTLWLSLFV